MASICLRMPPDSWSAPGIYPGMTATPVKSCCTTSPVQLSLKSFLQFRGWSDERCRLEIRHDLTKALDAAEGLGFRPSYPDLHSLLAILSPYYCRHRIRDLAAHEPALLSPQQALKAAEELLSDVRAACPKGSAL